MSLNRGEINPLSVLRMRRLSFIPNHFSKIVIKFDIPNVKKLDQWIDYNLNSRYAIRKSIALNENNRIVESLEIGLEDPIEISILTLGCPYLLK